MIPKPFLLPLGLLATALPSHAVDVSVNLTASGAPTETGFTNWEAGDNSLPADLLEAGLTFSVADINAGTTLRSIDRGGDDGYAGILPALTRTWWGQRASPTGSGGYITLDVSGLAAGSYSFTSWHLDHQDQTGEMKIEFSDDDGASFIDVVAPFDLVAGDDGATAPIERSFNFTATGADIQIRFTNTASGGSGSAAFALANGFTITGGGPDETAPALQGTDPADDATEVLVSRNLVATFDESVLAGTGGIELWEDGGGSPLATYDVTSAPELSFSGNTVTIDPASDLAAGVGYHVRIDSTAIVDGSGNAYAGITDATTWNFTTDGTAPTVVATGPVDDATDVTISSDLTLSFSEDVQTGLGDLTIHLASDDTVVASIDINSGLVTVTGSEVVINPPIDLAYDTAYYVNLPAGALTDLSGNDFAGFTDTATWSFTTAALDPDVLFADTFNRSDDTDLNASASGKSGSLGALNWLETASSARDPRILNNEIQIGESGNGGGNWALAYVDHNFIDPVITDARTFTVAVDIVNDATNGFTRAAGIVVGGPASAFSGWNTGLPNGSDFGIGYDGSGTEEFRIWENGGSAAQTIPLSFANPDRLEVVFTNVTDFNAGTTINYEVFNNGVPVASGSFVWSGTNENHIGLFSNWTNDGAEFDNFEVRAPAGTPGDPFTTWAGSGTLPGTVTFEGDLNGDGVQDGLAFLLGVANPDDDATGALPTVGEDGSGGLQMTFDCLPPADRGTATLGVQHSSDLSTWTPSPIGVEVPDSSGGPISNISFAVTPGTPLNTVTVTIDSGAAAGGRLFGRLQGEQ